MAKSTEAQYRLTQTELRALTIKKRPVLDRDGNTVVVANPGHKPYRFSDGTLGAPGGSTFMSVRRAFSTK